MTNLDAVDLAIDEDYELRRFNTRQIIERKSCIRPAHEFEQHSKFNMPRVKDQIFADEQFAHLMPYTVARSGLTYPFVAPHGISIWNGILAGGVDPQRNGYVGSVN